jgi:UDP-glucose 4-epimerase
MSQILVTGGAGYIGSHTVKELRARGYDAVVFDDLSSGRRDAVRGAELVVGDLMDRAAVRTAFRGRDIAAVLHFASLIQVGESYVHPRKYYTRNLVTSLNLLDAAIDAGVRAFIFSSSAAVYGIPQRTPVDEDHPTAPINPYGWTKLMVERILQDYDRAYGLRFISLRYFNASGADPDGELGECHDPETHLIPNILGALSGRLEALNIYGEDFPTPDGTAVRDYIHVSDLAAAHVLALQRLGAEPRSEFINLGTNRGYSVREVVAAAERLAGRPVPVRMKPRREGDVPVLLASKAKAEKVLGWTPRLSDLETIIATARRWNDRA